MTAITRSDVDEWLSAFSACVRGGDLDAGRDLFDPAAVGFGTVVDGYDDTDELVRRQWADVWPRTTDFDFDDHRGVWGDDSVCTVAATWRSIGIDSDAPRSRTGRVTIVLRRGADGRLRAVHTHFSMTPGTPA